MLQRPMLQRPPPPMGVPTLQSELSLDARWPRVASGEPAGPKMAAQSVAKVDGVDGGVMRCARPSSTTAATTSASVGTCRKRGTSDV